ncbi:MAG: PilW family protein [Pseudomonadota bacterium]
MRGVSLIELMISMAIGLMVVAAIGFLYVNSRQTYRQQDNLARIQENGRFALDVMAKDIRMAGFWGCAGRTISEPVNTLNTPNNYLYAFNIPVQGHEATGTNTWLPALDGSITNPLSGSDIITIRGAFGGGTIVTQHPGGSPPGSADIKTTPGAPFEEDDILFVTDCINAAVFQVTNINDQGSLGVNIAHNTGTGGPPGNATKALGKEYTGGEVFRAEVITYYLRNNPAGRPSLYRITNGTAEELVENVEALQINYGIDTNSDRAVDQYTTADGVADWNQVRAIRIRLLLVSPENNILDQAQTYRWDTDSDGDLDIVNAPDRRLRYVFSTSVGIRNRLP